MIYKILCIGNQWRGADDGSLFRAFSRAGHLIHIIDDKLFIPDEVTSFISKAIKRTGRKYFIKDYNKYLLEQFKIFNPDLVCIYKGASVQPQTLIKIKSLGIPIICIYPDVSLFDHGNQIPKCIPFYDHIFTTKTFGIDDLKAKFNYTSVSLIQHCFDPDIHRKWQVGPEVMNRFLCNASFIGSYSIKKDKLMSEFIQLSENDNIKIWGNGWQRAKNPKVINKWQKQAILGDLYALAINGSLINIAILSEQGRGASSGDMITSRSFHIPGAGGFMLHERTDEFLSLFKEGEEAEGFSNAEEMADKANYYRIHDQKRIKISLAGHRMVLNRHSSNNRVAEILSKLREIQILKS